MSVRRDQTSFVPVIGRQNSPQLHCSPVAHTLPTRGVHSYLTMAQLARG